MTAQDKPRVQASASARIAMDLPELTTLRLGDIWCALRAGVVDFFKAPEYGLAVAGGCFAVALMLRLCGAGLVSWGLVAVVAVPLLAPFLLTGFYEVSARRMAGRSLHLGEVMRHLDHARHGQGGWVGLCLAILSVLWAAVALGLWQLTGAGHLGLVLQALWALPIAVTLYGVAAISLPMLHDCRLDALTAMLHSTAMVRENRGVMLVWAFVAALLLGLAAMTWFIGLILVVPVLGHAQWHLYRRATL